MDLPNDSIGISDLLAHRDCPRRMSWQMRRHVQGEPPEAKSAANAYGSAIHDAISHSEEYDCSDEVAVQHAYKAWKRWLGPADVQLLKEDLAKYHDRDPGLGCRTVLNEGEIRVPLMEHEGRTIFFRAKIDRLYQRLDNEGLFLHVDYKSSAHRKTRAEVHEDLQMWAYNWAIHEFFPECEDLHQHYDQLRFGVVPTTKSERQREWMLDWLRVAALAVLEDEDTGPDGLLLPTWNEWCPWCPLKMDCPEITTGIVTKFTEATIKGLAPVVPVTKKDGTPGQRTVMKLDIDLIQDYVDQLPKAKRAKATLEAFEKEVSRALRQMPAEARHALGYSLRERSASVWGPSDLRAVHELLGDEFYYVIGLSKASVEEFYDGNEDRQKAIIGLADKEATSPVLVKDQDD